MKKIVIIIVMGFLLVGCQQDTSKIDQEVKGVVYNGVTHGYSYEQAAASGDVVQESGITENISELDSFMSFVDDGNEAAIRITKFITESVPVINTLEYRNNKFEYTAYQQQQVIYDDISVNETSEHTEYVLTSGDESLVILRISNWTF